MEVRVATEDDVDGVAATLTAAFEADPLWSWAFPDGGLADLWRLLVSSALRYPWVWVADDYAAASVWIPPGGIELTEAEEASLRGRCSMTWSACVPPRFCRCSSAWTRPIRSSHRTTT